MKTERSKLNSRHIRRVHKTSTNSMPHLRIRDRKVYTCDGSAHRSVWESRVYGVAFVLQTFLVIF